MPSLIFSIGPRSVQDFYREEAGTLERLKKNCFLFLFDVLMLRSWKLQMAY